MCEGLLYSSTGGKEETRMLSEEIMTLISKAFSDLQSTVTQVLAVSVPAVVAIICLSSGVNYALGKVRGVLGWA